MTNLAQTITRESLGKSASDLLTRLGPMGTFTLRDVARILGAGRADWARKAISELRAKGWVERVAPGTYAVVPLSSGAERNPHLHEYLAAMKLVDPAAVSFLSALNFYGMTEQLPSLVYVSTTRRVFRRQARSLGVAYQIIVQHPRRYFGLRREWIGELPFTITDPEKTLIDGLTLPEYSGGVHTVASALAGYWDRIDEERLREYALRVGVSAVVKRLGYILETLGIGHPERLREKPLATGYPRLDPTLPAEGKHNRRWGLLINLNLKP